MFINRVQILVEAPFAMFAQPELHAEAYSYPMITVSAARGILDAIYWHPQFKWRIDQIVVANEIRRINVKTNGVGSKIPTTAVITAIEKGTEINPCYVTGKEAQMFNSSMLVDVKYGITAHIVLTPGEIYETLQKSLSVTHDRLKAGHCHHQPTCGRKELIASVKPWDGTPLHVHESLRGEKDLGIIFHDFQYSDDMAAEGEPEFRHVVLNNGIYNVGKENKSCL